MRSARGSSLPLPAAALSATVCGVSRASALACSVLTALFVLVVASVFGQPAPPQSALTRQVVAVRVETAPRVDGRLDDAQWQAAAPTGDFHQSEPYEGQEATERTEVRLVYDADTLYIGVRCTDEHDGGALANALREDFEPNDADFFQVLLDPYHDRRNGVLFTINPNGARRDAQVFDEGSTINVDWDTVWTARTVVTDTGWTAELAIPFRSLSFDEGAAAPVWGVNFARKVRRRNEIDFWSQVPRRYDISRVSLAGDLTGLQGIRHGRNLRIKPFAIAETRRLASRRRTELLPDGGLDVKYSMTPTLTLDVTANTDFSQVEVDEQQVNITRFPVIFPEKREFFLENSGTFQFGDVPGERGPDRAKETQLFFSRRIGIFPDGHPRQGEPLPILGGARLSGRVGRYSLGLMSLQTGAVDDDTATAASEALPSNNFSIARVKRDVLTSSNVGAVVVSRQAAGSADFSRAVGLDGNFRFGQTLAVNAYIARSMTDGLTCGDDCQERTEKLSVQYRSNRYRMQAIYANIQEHFNPEVGIKGVPTGRTSARSLRTTTEVHMRPPRNPVLREVNPHIRYFVILDRTASAVYQESHITPMEFFFHNGSRFEFSYNPRRERLDRPFLAPNSPNVVVPVGDYTYGYWQFEAETDASRPLFATADAQVGAYYTGRSRTVNIAGTLRPGYRWSAQATYVDTHVSLLGRDYDTRILRSRLIYSFSTRMFLNALIQYNSVRRQVTSNIRFDFLHRPLSNLYLVFNEARDVSGAGRHDRAFTVKYTHMLAF